MPDRPPESFWDFLLQVVSDTERTKNLVKVMSAASLVVIAVAAAIAVLIVLAVLGGVTGWVTAVASCLGATGVALLRRSKKKR